MSIFQAIAMWLRDAFDLARGQAAPAAWPLDEDPDDTWHEKVRLIRESEAFITSVSNGLPEEFGDYLHDFLERGACPTCIPDFIRLVEGREFCSAQMLLRDVIGREERNSIRAISPLLLQALRFDDGVNH
jgi:hypothetical protein